MFSSTFYPMAVLFAEEIPPGVVGVLYFLLVVLGFFLICELIGLRYIPNSRVGIVEKLWSAKGSVEDGRIIALTDEAGYQADLLRGGFHLGFWRWQYRIHKVALVTVPQGKIGYVYARDGQPLQPSQTLGRVVACNYFQDARTFLGESSNEDPAQLGQRGRQRAILREGVYAINLALFVVITEDVVYRLNLQGQRELETLMNWQKELRRMDGFSPVVIGAVSRQEAEEADEVSERRPRVRAARAIPATEVKDPFESESALAQDNIGIVTIQDGP